MTISNERLDAIAAITHAMGMSVGEQRELVRGYRECGALREALAVCVRQRDALRVELLAAIVSVNDLTDERNALLDAMIASTILNDALARERDEACPSGKCSDPARECFGSGCLEWPNG